MTTARSSRPDPTSLVRAVGLVLTIPVEVGARLIEAAPAVVDRIPSTAERVRREIVLARFIGRLAVDQGLRELRSRATTQATPRDAPTEPVSQPEPIVTPTAHEPVPDVETLALADYDHLSSAQVVAMLDGLDADERDAIRRYERARRHRRTILGKLDQLEAPT